MMSPGLSPMTFITDSLNLLKKQLTDLIDAHRADTVALLVIIVNIRNNFPQKQSDYITKERIKPTH